MERIDGCTMISYEFTPEAVVVGGGDYPTHEKPLAMLHATPRVVCCDGAADEYISHGLTPWRIVGDGDSLSEKAKTKYSEIIRINPDQETNDQTKAVKFLLAKGLRRIAIVGATGKRDDHTLGNIALLAEYQKMGADVRSYTAYGVFIPCSGSCTFNCEAGAQVSVFNINAKELSSDGLSYPIYDFTAWWQGTLNQCPTNSFSISAKGDYIVYITYKSK